jgi:uncharacterized protein (TIGR01619 family)
MKTLLLLTSILLFNQFAFAQQARWDVYNKKTTDGEQLIRVNNSLYDVEPVAATPYLVKVTHRYSGGGKSKLPTKTELANLIRIQDDTKKLIATKTTCNLAGASSRQNTCDIYFYVTDTTDLRHMIQKQYKKHHYSKYAVNIKEDKKWDGYFSVLYPSEEERQMIYYKRMVARLLKAGDVLNKPHKVTHWVYFKNEEDMLTYKQMLTNNIDAKYTFESQQKNPYARYQIKFYHLTPITAEAILGTVKDIKGQMVLNAGSYGGWETIVAAR